MMRVKGAQTPTLEKGDKCVPGTLPLRSIYQAYASVVDNRSNDPILIPARPWPKAE